mmetsp:Transcript_4276/g.7127  ORF Transcript_4276/g.7127 Transcript_4276/m.7127 type:complete len:273 (+) Transcript_4276:48-866(+)|eukprot:CAMPEP_0119012930 /NCGR_PEP_ID=MMETSP1176-20130426/7703_1 /TAXON_ID=265551 /ORGANISM="Synedropsis recta cf, Strain CCMP1620" /LENGTH=272 /DNA_ID=CAMNT_0006965969 /DNA_START=28 /DNA_END=846 /DNA_ORIENTATION=+
MGAVHGVYLKYVGLSALSYAGYSLLMSGAPDQTARSLSSAGDAMPLWKLGAAAVLGYSTILNGAISIMFKLEKGMGMIGKDPKTGQIPTWSYVLLFPFHIPTIMYTHIHTRHGGSMKMTGPDGTVTKVPVPVASEVQPGWWVGGCYGHELNKEWGGIVDLTVEFPERMITKSYLSVPTWDGVPATPAQLEDAAIFAVKARAQGDVMVHCAHGRGRSTTVMCACLVKAGLFPTWQEAFEKGIKPFRPVCKLNGLMRKALTAWQEEYVNDKKAQ